MAKAKTAAAPAAKPKGKSKGKGKGLQILFAVMMFLTVIWPTACLLIPGMLPTLICLITDRDREKALALTVGATNFAGCLPFVLQLWSMGQNLDNAIKLLREPMTVFVMLAGAGVGYVIYTVVPGVVAGVMAGTAGGRIAKMKANMEELKRIWGPDVAGDRPCDEYGNFGGSQEQGSRSGH